MGQPLLWVVLGVVAVVAGAARLALGRPLLTRWARPVPAVAVTVAVLASLALVFHCAAMFFTPWVTAVPGSGDAVAAVNAMGTTSELAYWIPAVVLVLTLWRVRWPALVVLAVSLVGVGTTMFGSFPLPTHLAWLSAAVLVALAVFTGLIGSGHGEPRRAGTISGPPHHGPRSAV